LGLLSDETGRKEYFDNTLGIGFDAVVTIRSHKLPVVRGFLMYLTAVIQTIILNFNPMQLHVETDTESWDSPTLMLALCNGSREGGGFLVAPQARNDDGILEYASIRKVGRPMMFRLLPEVMKGTHGRFKQVRTGTFHKMTQEDWDLIYRVHVLGGFRVTHAAWNVAGGMPGSGTAMPWPTLHARRESSAVKTPQIVWPRSRSSSTPCMALAPSPKTKQRKVRVEVDVTGWLEHLSSAITALAHGSRCHRGGYRTGKASVSPDEIVQPYVPLAQR
jgi:hypothetical protein